MEHFVARQPIFDTRQNVSGYELLYRSGSANIYDGKDGSQASLTVIRNAFLMFGLEALTGQKKAFINFTKNLLVSGVPMTLPPQQTVIEILEDVEPDESALRACRKLKEAGFTLALDDYTTTNTIQEALLQLADIVKVDFRLAPAEDRWKIPQRFSGQPKQVLAEKVETRHEFDEAVKQGYVLFQGYFFSRPVIVSGKDIPTIKLNYVQMVKEVNRRDLDFQALEKVIKQDTSLCYTLFNYINSAYFGVREHVGSIRQAMVLLGETELRKWASLVLFTFIGRDHPPEVVVASLIRAKLCESLASHVGLAGSESELFLMGMFSMLDVLVGRPLREILDSVKLSTEVKNALLGMSSKYRDILELAMHYQTGNWEQFSHSVKKLSLSEAIIPELYLESVKWADQIAGLKSSSGRN